MISMSFLNGIRTRAALSAAGSLLGLIGAGCMAPVGGAEGAPNGTEAIEEVSEAISHNGHEYLFFVSQTDFTTANDSCFNAGAGSLVTVDDANEDAWLGYEEALHGGGSWWLGYTEQGNVGFWRWVSGTPNGYVNWVPGDPHSGLKDYCASKYSQGQWDNMGCSRLAKFVCEANSVATGNTGTFSYSVSNTNSATQNYFAYAFNLRHPTTSSVTLGTCGVPGASTADDTFLRLFNPSGVQVAFNDDACSSAGSNLSFTGGPAGTYTIHAGCYGSSSCSGTVAFTTTFNQ
jgi:Lectin C-type domain